MKKHLILKHIAVFVMLGLLVRFGCPIYRIFHISCPCCGTTRAWLHLLKGQPAQAFSYNAFFLFIPIGILIFAHRDTPFLKKHAAAIDRSIIGFAVVLFLYHLGRCTLPLFY